MEVEERKKKHMYTKHSSTNYTWKNMSKKKEKGKLGKYIRKAKGAVCFAAVFTSASYYYW